MNDALQGELKVMSKEVRAAAIPDACKKTVLWCMEQLPTLYTKLHLTNESRYSEEINRLVQGLLKEVTTDENARPDTQKLATSISDQLQRLHEEHGFPALILKSPYVAPSRSRKKSAAS